MAIPPPLGALGRFTTVAGAYFVVSLVGVAFVVQPEQLSVFWPGGGLALGYLLVTDRRHWPSALAAVFAGNVAGNLAHGHTLAVSCGFAVVNAVEPLLCAVLLARLRPGRFALDRTLDVGLLFGLPVTVCAATALAGAGVVTAGLGAPSYWSVWRVWWLADALGVILFAPLALAWTAPIRFAPWRRVRAAEAAVWLAVLAAVTWAVFVSDLRVRYPLFALPYPVFPLLLVVALRTGLRGTAVAVAATVGVATWGTVHGLGPVGSLALPAAVEVLIAQGFAAVVALSSFVLGTALHERGEREREVGELNRVLAERVREVEGAAVALRESEERFNLAVLGSQDGIWDWSVQTGAVYFSPRWKGMVGYADGEVANRFEDWERLVHPDDLPHAKTVLGEYLAGSTETYSVEFRMREKGGGYRWILARGVALRDADGRPCRMAGSHTDITARKEAELAQAANEALLRQFVRHAPAAIAMLDRDMRYVQVSDRWVTDYHLTGQELAGRSHYDVFPDIPERWKAIHRRVLAGAVEACEEDPFPRADGRLEWLQWECRPWRTADGTVGGLIMFTQVITARKAAEAALRASEERFRVLFEYSSDAHLIFDEAGGIIDCNNAAIGMLRCGDKSAVLALHPAVLSPEFQPDGRRSLEKCVEMDATARRDGYHRFDWTHRRMDGEEFPCEVTLTPVVLAGRSALLVVWHDLTERAGVAAALQESEERFREAFDNAPIGMALVALCGRWLRVNRILCESFGRTESELLATDFQTLTHPDDLDSDLGMAARLVAGEFPSYQIEKRYRHKDGHLIHTLLAVSVVRDRAGTPLYYVSHVKDITERKRAEAALRDSEERYRSVVQVLAEGIVVQDTDGRIVAFNDRAGQILGLSRDQLTGRTSHDPDWRAVREDGSPFPGTEHPSMVALATGRPVFDVLMGVERPTRERVWLTVNAIPFGDAARQVVASFHDVTEARRLNARILDSLREKDVMLREIHHRVKNNLAVIASLFHLQSGYTTDGPILRLLKEAQDRVRSMALVHEHLYNSADLGAVNFSEYARSLAEQLFRSYRLPGAAVALAFDIRPTTLGIDQAVPCGLILNELVSNALKHAFPDRGGTLTVAVRADEDGCELRVADDGVGIPADRLDGKPRSLGLRLIRTLARQLNGTADFRPAAPGTDVRLRFPILPTAPRDRP